MTTEHSGSSDPQRSLELLWGLKEAPTRGPKPGLTLERIVVTAVRIADAEGLGAVSMRRVATELGVGTMSLYRYVPGKGDLLELMLDHAYGLTYGPEGPQAPGSQGSSGGRGWRSVMEDYARGSWRLNLEHRWLLQIPQARPLLGPNAVAGFEFAMTALDGLGLTDQERVAVLSSIEGYVGGSARTHIDRLEAANRTGISDEEFWSAQEPLLTKAMLSGDYPTMARMSEDSFAMSGEDAFEFGLLRLLDGIEAFITAKGGITAKADIAGKAGDERRQEDEGEDEGEAGPCT